MTEEDKGSVRAPEFPEDLEWINSDPLTIEKLKGKIVLIDIWDYTCVNCIRTLPYLKEWYERYASYGFVVIGVHTPEFEFAKDSAAVLAAVERFGIEYPVVLDNDYEIWSLYANEYWPREYLLDAQGYIVYDHAGEGNYQQTELAIQRYLERITRGVTFSDPYVHPGSAESGSLCYPVTPELYAGYERGRLGNPEGYDHDAPVLYNDTGEYKDGCVYAHGLWLNQPQSLKHARTDRTGKDHISVRYHALSVNAVMHRADDDPPYRVCVKQDGEPVAAGDRGEDLKADADGTTYLTVEDPRMYRIVKNRAFGTHTLELSSESGSFDIYSFTFGSCKVSKQE